MTAYIQSQAFAKPSCLSHSVLEKPSIANASKLHTFPSVLNPKLLPQNFCPSAHLKASCSSSEWTYEKTAMQKRTLQNRRVTFAGEATVGNAEKEEEEEPKQGVIDFIRPLSSMEVPAQPTDCRPRIAAVEPIAEVIDGKAIAQEIRSEVAVEVSRMRDALGKVPGLAVVLVGARKDSETYVRSKKKACVEAGIASFGIDLPEDSSEEEVERAVRTFNDNPSVHGVLVQLPLPQHINEEKILNAISIEKDVDGFHPLNIGRLAMQGRKPLFVPCTPKGCIELLLRSGIDMKGKKAVVIGRSNIVGMPVAMLLQRHNATVTIVHSCTKNPTDFTREADILISAAGVPNLVRGDWLKPGAAVIDVGINAVEDPKAKRGYRLVGDVCYEEASRIASAITPVPGGVGPMTIAMLLSNTLESAKRTYGFN